MVLIILVYRYWEYHTFCTWQVNGLAKFLRGLEAMVVYAASGSAKPRSSDEALESQGKLKVGHRGGSSRI